MTPSWNAATSFFDSELSSSRTLVILRGYPPEETLRLCARAESMGVRLVEIPAQTPAAFEALASAVAWAEGRDVTIGAGTVTTVQILRAVHDVGARFTVAPGVDASVSRAGEELGVPHLPGVATATEVSTALGLGHTWLKVFPASVLGAAWFPALKGPFPEAKFVATGGVTPENAHDFLTAGAEAVSLGGSFATADPGQVRSLGR
jgi:2-dehydro-3-deoxyphosphogluconate aldolase/(4S)-4-hydroxy-2-oxoglutarate aldolase